MRSALRLLALTVALLVLAPPVPANAISDLSIRTEKDEKRNTHYTLINNGERTVRVKVRIEKLCTSVANNQKPVEREYWIRPGETIKLGMSWSRSTCRRDYRILEARYS
jgi:hypothetical protein